jgi:hypothetical protein
MTPDDAPAAAPQGESLEFEHADFTAAPAAAPALVCAACRQPIADAYYEINGKILCGGCRDRVTAHVTGGSTPVRFLRAVLFGGLAALAGTSLYFLVLALTGYEVGLIAILVGFMVGAAVRKGSRHRGGLAYQLLAVFLTYTSIVAAYVPLMVAQAVKQARAQPAAAGAKEIGPTKEQPQPEAPKNRRPDPAAPTPGVGQLIVLLFVLVALIYAAPFLAGIQNLLGLAIIFFGLFQAWQMNRRAKLVINGPFRVESGGSRPEELPAHA